MNKKGLRAISVFQKIDTFDFGIHCFPSAKKKIFTNQDFQFPKKYFQSLNKSVFRLFYIFFFFALFVSILSAEMIFSWKPKLGGLIFQKHF